MLNFREELGKIEKEKFDSGYNMEKEAELFLQELLDNYFKKMSASFWISEHTITFQVMGLLPVICVKSGNDIVYEKSFENVEKAYLVLNDIALQLKREEYEVNIKRTFIDHKFSIRILPKL